MTNFERSAVAVLALLVCVSSAPLGDNILCDPDCQDYTEFCANMTCDSQWVFDNCKVTCDKCTPCEEFFVTKGDFDKDWQEMYNVTHTLSHELHTLEETISLKLEGIIPTNGSDQAVVILRHVPL